MRKSFSVGQQHLHLHMPRDPLDGPLDREC